MTDSTFVSDLVGLAATIAVIDGTNEANEGTNEGTTEATFALTVPGIREDSQHSVPVSNKNNQKRGYSLLQEEQEGLQDEGTPPPLQALAVQNLKLVTLQMVI